MIYSIPCNTWFIKKCMTLLVVKIAKYCSIFVLYIYIYIYIDNVKSYKRIDQYRKHTCCGNVIEIFFESTHPMDHEIPNLSDKTRHRNHHTTLYHHGVSNNRGLDRFLNHLFRRRSQKTSKLWVTGLCEGYPPVTAGFPSQRASNAENVSIWWCHHGRLGISSGRRGDGLNMGAGIFAKSHDVKTALRW